MIEYSHAGRVTYACFAGETDNLRYNWFKALHNEFKRRLPFMENAVISGFILKFTPVERAYHSKAKCNPEDAYNEKIGEEIARDRLLEKYYYDVARIQDDIKQYLEDKIESNLRKEYN